MKNRKRSFWIILDHPQKFTLALWIARTFNKKYGIDVNLLISSHEYWKYFRMASYKNYFNKIFWFRRANYPPPIMNPIKQIIAAFLLIPELFFLRNKVSNLKIQKGDLLIGLSLCQFLENLILSCFPEVNNVSILGPLDYQYAKLKPDFKTFKRGFSSMLADKIQIVFGMHPTTYLYRKETAVLGDGDYYLNYSQPIEKVYKNIIVTSRNTKANMAKTVMSKSGNTNVVTTNYPTLSLIKTIKYNAKTKIVFMGQPFLKIINISPDDYITNLNKCLNFLRAKYDTNYQLIYKVHPRENEEVKAINLERFTIDNKKTPAELYLLQHQPEIEAVFSVTSSASRSAYEIGIDSYLFAKVFHFNRNVMDDLYVVCGEMPYRSFLTNLKFKPKSLKYYLPKENSGLEKKLRSLATSA